MQADSVVCIPSAAAHQYHKAPHTRPAASLTRLPHPPAAALAEARSRALAAQPGAAMLGSVALQRCMVALRTMAQAVVADSELSAHTRELALEVLFWMSARWGPG